jgi:hypothetical protein
MGVHRLGPLYYACGFRDAVAKLVEIESGVVSGVSNPKRFSVSAPMETTTPPWEIISRTLSCCIWQTMRANNSLGTCFDPTDDGPRVRTGLHRDLCRPRRRWTPESV